MVNSYSFFATDSINLKLSLVTSSHFKFLELFKQFFWNSIYFSLLPIRRSACLAISNGEFLDKTIPVLLFITESLRPETLYTIYELAWLAAPVTPNPQRSLM